MKDAAAGNGSAKHGHAWFLRQLDGRRRYAYDGITMDAPERANDWEATAETLVALGAPLSGWRPNRRLAPETALALALRFAQMLRSSARSLSCWLARGENSIGASWKTAHGLKTRWLSSEC